MWEKHNPKREDPILKAMREKPDEPNPMSDGPHGKSPISRLAERVCSMDLEIDDHGTERSTRWRKQHNSVYKRRFFVDQRNVWGKGQGDKVEL